MLKSVIYFTVLLINVVVSKPDYHFNQELDGWLKLHVEPATWQEAFLTCHYEGAVLASPIDSRLSAALRYIIRRSELEPASIYIGTNARFSPGDYFSIEGVPLADMNVKWNSYFYEEKPGDCLRFTEDGSVQTSPCDQWRPYVCYKKRDETSEMMNNCGTYDNEYNLNQTTGSCYKLHRELKTWDMAYKICTAEGGHLAIINDQREADAVTVLFPEAEEQYYADDSQFVLVHIGLRDWNNDNLWLSIHGEKLEYLYNTWAEGQPDHKTDAELAGGCGSLLRDGTLYENWCAMKQMFICEKDPASRRFERSENHRPYFFTYREL
ncbi:hypothetical protein PYW07_010368 [Mythimna separata]|uniref:C-type lectin domain-containing protein n=1 Tax=Mythimna separata TaxID=271217 RepID=A0AAD7Y9Z5_MYTSE|nr:hypothetical protein PYW07_010368 [Mythimna separata]